MHSLSSFSICIHYPILSWSCPPAIAGNTLSPESEADSPGTARGGVLTQETLLDTDTDSNFSSVSEREGGKMEDHRIVDGCSDAADLGNIPWA